MSETVASVAEQVARSIDTIIERWCVRREAFEIIKDDEKADLVTSCIADINVALEPLRLSLRDRPTPPTKGTTP